MNWEGRRQDREDRLVQLGWARDRARYLSALPVAFQDLALRAVDGEEADEVVGDAVRLLELPHIPTPARGP